MKAVVDASAGTLFTACVVRLERKGRVETYATGTLCPDPSAPPDAPCTSDAIFSSCCFELMAPTSVFLSSGSPTRSVFMRRFSFAIVAS